MLLFEEHLGSAISNYGVSAKQSNDANDQAHERLSSIKKIRHKNNSQEFYNMLLQNNSTHPLF